MNNIILIWMSWSGKTNFWKMLAKKMNMNFLDFDDDIIEKVMKKTVWEKLLELWDEKFLEMEEELVLNLDMKNTILATSWSVPLREKSIQKLKQLWIIIYLNIWIDIIKQRLKRMKVDRIVWMKDMTIDEILNYRMKFYNNSYDYKFDFKRNWTKEENFEDFFNFFANIKK